MLKLISTDIMRYTKKKGLFSKIKVVLKYRSLKAIIVYRFGYWVYNKCNTLILRQLSRFIYKIFEYYSTATSGIYIDPMAEIGKGFYIGHYGSIWIGPIHMGENCNISLQVVIGVAAQKEQFIRYTPSFGDNVYIAPGAKIFGNIKIGKNVQIGANSVVSKNIPDNSIVVGNPGRVIGYVNDMD